MSGLPRELSRDSYHEPANQALVARTIAAQLGNIMESAAAAGLGDLSALLEAARVEAERLASDGDGHAGTKGPRTASKVDMRKTLLLILALTTAEACGAAHALEASDSMSSWKEASAAERAGLLKKLLKESNSASQANIIKCVDQAAAVPGHADLRVTQIVKACMSSKDDSQPV